VTAPLQYGTQPAPDPTAVMGRRTLAWIADLLLYAAVVAVGFASMAEYTEIPAGVADEDACALLEAQNGELPGGCIAMDGTLYLLDTSEAGAQTLISLGWLAFFIVLQGLTGGSPGKLLFGLRVVDQYGARCGIGKSLGRTLMWAVDAAPWLVPLVGPIAAFTSTGHRRVGDLAAGTYVVTSAAVGSPVMPGTAAPPPGQTPWGAPPPDWAAVPTGPPTAPTWEASTLPELEDPAARWQPPGDPGFAPEPAPADGPPASPFVAPGADAPAPPTAPPAATPRDELPPPQWDTARGTYLQWEPNRQAWLQWDAAGERWKPIDT
jgi:hypothetical protein